MLKWVTPDEYSRKDLPENTLVVGYLEEFLQLPEEIFLLVLQDSCAWRAVIQVNKEWKEKFLTEWCLSTYTWPIQQGERIKITSEIYGIIFLENKDPEHPEISMSVSHEVLDTETDDKKVVTLNYSICHPLESGRYRIGTWGHVARGDVDESVDIFSEYTYFKKRKSCMLIDIDYAKRRLIDRYNTEIAPVCTLKSFEDVSRLFRIMHTSHNTHAGETSNTKLLLGGILNQTVLDRTLTDQAWIRDKVVKLTGAAIKEGSELLLI